MNKILITGKNGQVGRALQNILKDEDGAIYLSRSELDLSKPELVYDIIAQHKPSAIINAAAYTNVDKAEKEEQLAFYINGQSVGRMADYAFEHDIPFIHYSTDYVFGNNSTEPHKEDDETNPINAYGRTKLAGERHIIASAQKRASAQKFEAPEQEHGASAQKNTAKWLIFRTSWVYDATGHNFLNTMLTLGKEREVLTIISDQIGAPTFAGDIAKHSIEALNKARKMEVFPSGIYNLCNSGYTSWNGFAQEIFRQAIANNHDLKIREVMDIKTSQYKTVAQRPLNSRMSHEKLKDIFAIEPRKWQEPIKESI